MNLNYTLSDDNLKQLELDSNEKILYCVPFDLSSKGRLIDNSYTVVTNLRLLIITQGVLTRSLLLSQCSETKSESPVDCGMLISTINGEPEILVRFTMKHHIRYSYIARGIRLLCDGKDYVVQSRENETTCQKCGKVLPGTKNCPYCDKNSRLRTKLWKIVSPYKFWILLAFLLSSAASLLNVLSAYILRVFMDDVLIPKSGTVADAAKYFIILISFGASIMLMSQLRFLAITVFSSKISHGLRTEVFDKIQQLSLSYVNKSRPGQLLNRVLWDTAHVKNFIDDLFNGLVSTLFDFLFAFVFLLVLDWKLALLSVLTLPLIYIMFVVRRKKGRHLWHRVQTRNDRLSNRLQDTLSGIRVVKSYGKEQDEEQRFRELNEVHARSVIRHELFWAKIWPIAFFLFELGWLIVAYFGGLQVLDGAMTPGKLLQATTYCGMLSNPVGWLARLPHWLNMLTIAIERIYDVLSEDPEVTNSELPEKMEIKGNMSFENVTFGYNSYEQVLSNINLDVKKGEMIGIVGKSGAGKSTLINLIMRLYDVDEGSIKIDGRDIRDIDMHTLHSQIGVVLQETFLFSDTVLNNIRYARPQSSMEDIIHAAKMANAHDFICKLPDGYNTYVGEKGYSLSGGERQRIAIARALLTDPSILILDEATSSLDTESEYQVQEALGRLTKGRTTFAIAHRLSTLRNADRLIVINDHTIAEAGTHNELIEKKGLYYGLVTAQLEINDISSFEEALEIEQVR